MLFVDEPEVKFSDCVPAGVETQLAALLVFWKFRPLAGLVLPAAALSPVVVDEAFTTLIIALLFGLVESSSLSHAARNDNEQSAPSITRFVIRRYDMCYLRQNVTPRSRCCAQGLLGRAYGE